MNVWTIGGGLAGALIGSLVTKGKTRIIGVIGGGGAGALAGYFGGQYMERQLPSGRTTTVAPIPDATVGETVSSLPTGKGVSQVPSLALPSGKGVSQVPILTHPSSNTATSASGGNWGFPSSTKGSYVPLNEIEEGSGGNMISDQIEVLLDRAGLPGDTEDYMDILQNFRLRRS